MPRAAGAYRHAVDIEQLTGSTPDGQGNIRKAWTPLYSGVMAAIETKSAREAWAGERNQSLTTHVVAFRWLPSITTKMRVKFGARYFTIAGARNFEERDIEIELDCVEGSV